MSRIGKAEKKLSDFNKKLAADAKKVKAKLKRKPKAKAPVAKFALAFALVLCASVMWAQAPTAADVVPKFQMSTAFAYLNQDTRFNNFSWAGKLGGDLSGVWNFSGFQGGAIAIEADGQLYSQPGAGFGSHGTVFAAGAGPRFTYYSKNVQPYGHLLFEAGHNSFTGFNFHDGQNGLVLVAGGGVGYRLSKHIGIDTGVDYMRTEFSSVVRNNFNFPGLFEVNYKPSQNNFRLKTGVNFYF